MPDFSCRSKEVEIMDDLQCNGEVVHQTLRELEFINRWLGGNAITIDSAVRLLKGHEKETVTIADLGCGSGEMVRLLAEWGRKNKRSLKLTGIDANPHIIEFAKKNKDQYPEISFEVIDIFSDRFREQKFDLILGTLFYHHFRDEDLTRFFNQIKTQARIGFVINDLHRHWLAYHSIRVLTRLFSRSSMVKFDAPLSVLRGFNKMELKAILDKAGIEKYSLGWKWAFRWQVTAC